MSDAAYEVWLTALDAARIVFGLMLMLNGTARLTVALQGRRPRGTGKGG